VSSRTGRNVPTESSGRTWGSTLRRSHVIADALNATKEATDTISITAGAYEAIKGSLPGQRGSPPPADPDGLIRVCSRAGLKTQGYSIGPWMSANFAIFGRACRLCIQSYKTTFSRELCTLRPSLL
jgi:hypothetical protein